MENRCVETECTSSSYTFSRSIWAEIKRLFFFSKIHKKKITKKILFHKVLKTPNTKWKLKWSKQRHFFIAHHLKLHRYRASHNLLVRFALFHSSTHSIIWWYEAWMRRRISQPFLLSFFPFLSFFYMFTLNFWLN